MENETLSDIRATYSKAKNIFIRHSKDIAVASMFIVPCVFCLALALSPETQFDAFYGRPLLAIGSLGLMEIISAALYGVLRPTIAKEFSQTSPHP